MALVGFALLVMVLLSTCHNTTATTSLVLGPSAIPRATAPPAALEVHFSPNGGCTSAIVTELGGAKKTVRVLAYSFTSEPVAQALEAAARRGVDVELVQDLKSSTESGCKASEVQAAGVKVFTDGMHPIAHNKVIVVDGVEVLTGSFNYSTQAERANAENLLIVRNADLAAQYSANWMLHQGHSKPYISVKK
jgi:phosphatidylserine/phosphatidylglycerophosphate/cardiolipin synthase-like enzyme